MISKKKSTEPEGFVFESALEQLESIVKTLEDEGTSLVNSMKAFEEGIRLTRTAQEYLEVTEQQLKSLTEHDGQPVSQDFDDGE